MPLMMNVEHKFESRDCLVMDHVGLVKSLASRLAHRLPAQVEMSELISVGVIGLIDAAGRYKPSLGVPFDAFARRRVEGAMLDSLRSLDWAPRSLRKKRRSVDSAIGQLRHELAREPAAGEVAAALHVSENDYDKMLDQIRIAELATIRQASLLEGRGLLDVVIDPSEGPYAQFERLELREQLAKAIVQLSERERQILALSFEEELTLAEIGEVIGVGESRVSQLRTQAIARLRSMLHDPLISKTTH
jgi:RNA polymerase sigma factor for flagellar operon FliA